MRPVPFLEDPPRYCFLVATERSATTEKKTLFKKELN